MSSRQAAFLPLLAPAKGLDAAAAAATGIRITTMLLRRVKWRRVLGRKVESLGELMDVVGEGRASSRSSAWESETVDND